MEWDEAEAATIKYHISVHLAAVMIIATHSSTRLVEVQSCPRWIIAFKLHEMLLEVFETIKERSRR